MQDATASLRAAADKCRVGDVQMVQSR